uniref:NADH dehydrogenase subunit 4L n=1 Tax=Megachile strupigera TaxID=1735309 RepID=A0A0N7IQU4_9HYME|nr:NADH dehydrogenase subunit 4L [Megachile strupigera]
MIKKLKFIFKSLTFFMVIYIIFFMLMLSKYYLLFLISLEFFVVLNLSLILMMNDGYLSWMFMYVLVISVCEASLGLSILVSLVNLSPKEGLMMMNLIK